MVIDSQALFFWFMIAVCVVYVSAWFIDFDYSDRYEKPFNFMFGWMIIGWFPMGGLGLIVGLILGYLMGMPPNEFTTGGAITGMVLYIPVGVIVHNLYVKHL
jgi:hypothetical protein